MHKMILFIRGLPGSGKTTISDILGKQLGWEVLHVDQYKSDFSKQNPEASFMKDTLPHSYERTLKELESRGNKNLVVDELFRDVSFTKKVQKYCSDNGIKSYWFRLKRDMETLNEVEQNRVTRKIKNSPEILKAMELEMDSSPIEGEVMIDNKDLQKSVDAIIAFIK